MKHSKYLKYSLFLLIFSFLSCGKEFLELEPRGTELEENYYQTEQQIFEGVIATYDVLQWGGSAGIWSMMLGLLNAASDDCLAGGSDASDQPNWVAWDNFTLDPFIGPQEGLWAKNYSGIYRANLILQKIEEIDPANINEANKARYIAEVKFLRAWYYFDLMRLFENVPLILEPLLDSNAFFGQTQNDPQEVWAQIEKDIQDARNTFELPETVPPAEYGRITQSVISAFYGKILLYRNDPNRMMEAAGYLEEVINSGYFALEEDYGNIFAPENEFGIESVFEITHSDKHSGGWENFVNGTEGNYSVQFFGMRDYSGIEGAENDYAAGWSFCPVTTELADFMEGDPRFVHTIIDGNVLKLNGASYTEGYQNTDYFIKKYAPYDEYRALDGEPALNWGTNVREIRYADVLLMAAEALVRGNGSNPQARSYLNQVRSRVGLQPFTSQSGDALLELIYKERRLELATEGHRYFDLVRTGRAAETLPGFVAGKNERLPIPQREIDLTEGVIKQNPGY